MIYFMVGTTDLVLTDGWSETITMLTYLAWNQRWFEEKKGEKWFKQPPNSRNHHPVFFNHILCFAFPSSSFPRHTSRAQSVSSARRAPSLYLPSSFSSAPGCLARSFFVLSHFHTVPSAALTIFEMPLLFEVLEKREWEGTRPRRIAVPSALMQALSICCRELRCMPRRCRARRT